LYDWINQFFVSLYKIPWVRQRWAKGFKAHSPSVHPFTPLSKPLAQSRLALITTGGVHLKTDPPFNMENPEGDASLRVFPRNTPFSELTITHKYYDHEDADQDLGCVLPILPLEQALTKGRLLAAGPTVYSCMGHILGAELERLLKETLPELVARLKAEEVDLCFITPA